MEVYLIGCGVRYRGPTCGQVQRHQHTLPSMIRQLRKREGRLIEGDGPPVRLLMLRSQEVQGS